MQRGLRAVCTTPSPVRLIASAGQTSAQVGWSQCMQMTGAVCTECARSTYSRWIIECPLCVSHSLHACTQDWQPMQRLGSMKNSIAIVMGLIGVMGCHYSHRSPCSHNSHYSHNSHLRLSHSHRADLIFWNLRDWV